MRKVSGLASKALMSYKKFKRGNTKVEVDSEGAAYLYLFGNLIACHEADGGLKITAAGHMSVTTKDRLNALPHVFIQQRDFVWYLNESQWNGEWAIVYNPDPRGEQWGRRFTLGVAIEDSPLTDKTDDSVEESIVDIKSSNGE